MSGDYANLVTTSKKEIVMGNSPINQIKRREVYQTKAIASVLTQYKGEQSWKAVAKRLDISPSYMAKILSGERKLTDNHITLLIKKQADSLKSSFLQITTIGDFYRKVLNEALHLQSKPYLELLDFASLDYDYRQDVIDYYLGELKSGDRYSLVLTEAPWELGDAAFEKVILKKVFDGVVVEYFVPDISDEHDNVFGIEQHLVRMGGSKLYETLQLWKKIIIRNHPNEDEQLLITKNLRVVPVPAVEGGLFFSPYIKYLHTTTGNTASAWCEVWYITSERDSRIFLSLDDNATLLLGSYINQFRKNADDQRK